MQRAREARAEKLHLIGEHIVVRQIQKLVLVGHERHRQQLHPCLLGKPICFAIITSPAGRHDIRPNIEATFGQRMHMIAGKLMIAKRFATIEAEVAVTSKEEFVLKRRIGEHVVNFAVAGNDARQPEHRLDTAAI